MNILSILANGVVEAMRSLYQTEVEVASIQLQKTRKEFAGNFTVVIFPLVKISKSSPDQTGEAVGSFLKQNLELVEGYNVVKGFLNIEVRSTYWLEFLNTSLGSESFGFSPSNSKAMVMVEFASPNTNKPLHLGHLRNIFLGNAVSRILVANGHKVANVQIINDRGIHICKSMLAWIKFGNGETPLSSGLKGDKLVGKYYVEFDKLYKQQQKDLVASGMTEDEASKKAPAIIEAQELLIKWEAKDPETYALWQTMNGWVYEGFNSSFEKMEVSFDKVYYESDTYLLGKDEVLKGLSSGAFFSKDDGSIWVDLTDEGLDEKALLRKDGTAMYITQDIGTAILRFKDFPETSYQIYTVGNEQEYHFKVLFKILKKLGFAQADKCYHLSYGMVELPEGKMKSREGTVVDADDIMQEMQDVAREVALEQGKLEGLTDQEREGVYHFIGMSALKYFLLKVDPVKNMLFNPKESIDFSGNTGPFILYTYVRTRAILRKFEENFGSLNRIVSYAGELEPLEVDLLQKLHEFPLVVEDAAKTYNPSLIANYTYELVKDFNSFYHDYPILRESNESKRTFRVQLSVKVGEVVRAAFKLLGINTVERM